MISGQYSYLSSDVWLLSLVAGSLCEWLHALVICSSTVKEQATRSSAVSGSSLSCQRLTAESANVETQISSFSSMKYASGIFLLHLSVMKLYYTDFETTRAAVLTQELQKYWYSRI